MFSKWLSNVFKRLSKEDLHNNNTGMFTCHYQLCSLQTFIAKHTSQQTGLLCHEHPWRSRVPTVPFLPSLAGAWPEYKLRFLQQQKETPKKLNQTKKRHRPGSTGAREGHCFPTTAVWPHPFCLSSHCPGLANSPSDSVTQRDPAWPVQISTAPAINWENRLQQALDVPVYESAKSWLEFSKNYPVQIRWGPQRPKA